MDASGLEFGLSRGLLEFLGPDFVVSDRVLESLSVEAHIQAESGEVPVGDEAWWDVINRSLFKLGCDDFQPQMEGVDAFLQGLSLAVFDKVIPLAQRAGLGRRVEREFKTDPEFWSELTDRVLDAQPLRDVPALHKVIFRECRHMVRTRCEERDPDNARHVDLIAFFLINFWKATTLLDVMEEVVDYE
jgi:hypothetical protein